MKPVSIGGKKYRIVFRYPRKHSVKRNRVDCQIMATYPMENTVVQEFVGHGTSRCNLKEDIFDKEEGRRRSLREASLDLPRAVRTALWESYWGRYVKG